MSLVALVASSYGCSPEDHRFDTSDSGTDADADADTDTDTDTDSDTETETETETEGPPVDCSNIPSAPVSVTELDGPRGYHGIAFDTEGFAVGTDGASLLKAPYTGTTAVYVPGMGAVDGMDYLPSGDLVVADHNNGAITRVGPYGQTSFIVGDNNAYGIDVGPDGKIYVGNNSMLYRVEPSSGDTEVLTNEIPARGSAFSPDHDRLYITTLCAEGNIYVLDLDEDLNPVGALTLFATIPGGGWLDGIGVDACGNLFVPDYNTSSLYRISPEGIVSQFHYFGSQAYGHGLAWGSGLGGYDDEALYLPQPYDGNTVIEVVIGVPEA